MTATEVLQYLQKEIHSTVAATVDDDGLPATCAIDVMDADENGLYFLTARGKGFYSRLKRRGYIALTGMKGKDTMSRVAVSVRGNVRELGDEPPPVRKEPVHAGDLPHGGIPQGAHGLSALCRERRVVRPFQKAH